MKAVQIGCGKMGTYILRTLIQNKNISQLTVCDFSYSHAYEQDGVQFVPSLTDEELSHFDCAFVATPAQAHFSCLERLIRVGIKCIYVEKPAVMNQEELEKINAIRGNCKIVTGYILRQSETVIALKQWMKKNLAEGFHLELCSVTYQKNFPVTAEKRARGDIGVFEEIVHIWDLLFNYLEFRNAKCRLMDYRFDVDPDRSDRMIWAQLSYYLKCPDYNAMVRINSSFKAKEKKREFFFTFKNEEGLRRFVQLSFDNADDFDCLRVTDEQGNSILCVDYPSLKKLFHQTEEVLHFFETGESNNLCLFSESDEIIQLLKEVSWYQ